MIKQRTLKRPIRTTGIGLHTGEKIAMALRPAAPDTGIRFRRVDLAEPVEIAATPFSVGDTRLSTTLVAHDTKRNETVRIATVEHLLAAFAGLGIDNVWVDVAAAEIPVMDGSAAPFTFLIQSAGITEQQRARRFIRIVEPIEVREGDKIARLAPHDGFRLDFTIDFDHPAFHPRHNRVVIDLARASFVRELSRARTFGFLRDIEMLRDNGLALGGSLDNAVVVDEYRILNPEGLRYEDEFVRHKMLDAVGDLSLLGQPLIGAFTAYKSGHALNNLLVRKLIETPSAWTETLSDDIAAPPTPAFVPVLAA